MGATTITTFNDFACTFFFLIGSMACGGFLDSLFFRNLGGKEEHGGLLYCMHVGR